MLKIGNLELGHIPRIAAAFTGNTDVNELIAYKNVGIDIAEIRADLLQDCRYDAIKSEIEQFDQARLPTLLTVRSQGQGGKWVGSDQSLCSLLIRLIPDVDAIDVEIDSPEVCHSVISTAKSNRKLSIASYHDTDKTPPYDELVGIISSAKAFGADIIKIATQVNEQIDIYNLTQLTHNYHRRNVVIIGMGTTGIITRVMLPLFGSLFTFGHIKDQPVASGQLPVEELVELMMKFSPTYRQAMADREQRPEIA